MGFRTIIAFSNDYTHEWAAEEELGLLLSALSSSRGSGPSADAAHRLGIKFVECEHADTQTLIVADGYSAAPLTHTNWTRGQTNEQRDLALLKALADKLGYNVSKKPQRKAP